MSTEHDVVESWMTTCLPPVVVPEPVDKLTAYLRLHADSIADLPGVRLREEVTAADQAIACIEALREGLLAAIRDRDEARHDVIAYGCVSTDDPVEERSAATRIYGEAWADIHYPETQP